MSELALKLIAEAKTKNSTVLDLGNCGLKKLPKELFELTDLEELYLCNNFWDSINNVWIKSNNSGNQNKFSSLGENLKKLKKLKVLFANGDSKTSNWQLENLDFLYGLPNLKKLNLSCNENTVDYLVLKSLKNLQSLDLSNNGIFNLDFLKNLKKLKSLNLSSNNLAYFSNLEYISSSCNLRFLDLHSNNIKDIGFLKDLNQLEKLNLRSNQIQDISELKNKVLLTSLDLRENKLNDVSLIKNLIALEHLELGSNNISNITSLEKLKKLKRLNLSSNNISTINTLYNFLDLKSLDLSFNKIQEINDLAILKKLEFFGYRKNNLEDIEVLSNLVNLKSLDLRVNNIRDLTPLRKLTKLEKIDLYDNRIAETEVFKSLINLKIIDLGRNHLKEIEGFKNLKIDFLNLTNNKISSLESLIPLIKSGAKVSLSHIGSGINVFKNPITSPPLEIVQEGNNAIINYFEELDSQGIAFLFEAKMLIIGTGGAGKTSLMFKLQDRNAPLPKEEETTKGIQIKKKIFNTSEGNKFTINMWDFGGQEIYHATHQFFLTKRSLYVLVDDSRKDDKNISDSTFNYWLQIVELFGGNSPLLIVQNEKGDRSKDIDLKSMRGRYDFIKDKVHTNLLTCRNLDNVEKAIKYHIQELSHIGEPLPKQWVRIREALIDLSLTTPYISLNKYYEICSNYNIVEKEKTLHLSRYLHDLGTFLHFQEDALLKKTIILQNSWATKAVYNLLDDEGVKKNKGSFSYSEAKTIWNKDIYKDMIGELLLLIQKFEICYKLPNQKESYLIPQLLAQSIPEGYIWSKSNNLQLRYKYEFLPNGLLSRFIVRKHHYIYDTDKVWKSGVNLNRENTFAEVKEIYGENEISIRVSGESPRDLMTIIAEEIDELNSSFEEIKVTKFIPCNCKTCISSETPHFYRYKNIVERIKNDKLFVECDKPPYENVNARGLIDDLFKSKPEEKTMTIEEYEMKMKTKIKERQLKNVVNIQNIIYQPEIDEPNIQGQKNNSNNPNYILKILETWWGQRIIGGLFAGIFTGGLILSYSDWNYIDGFFIGFSTVTPILLYIGNPERRYFRAATTTLTAALSTILLNLAGNIEYKNENLNLNIELLSDYSWLIALILIGLAGYLFWLDYKKDKDANG